MIQSHQMNTRASYHQETKRHLKYLSTLISRAAAGKYQQNIKQPAKNNDFSELYKGIELLLNSFQEKVNELEHLNQVFADNLIWLEENNRNYEREKAFNEAIFDGLGEGMVVIDTQGKVIITNRQAESMLGLKSAKVVGKNWLKICDVRSEKGDEVPPSQRPIITSLKTGKKITISTLYYVNKRGHSFPVSITSSPVILEDKIIGAVGVFRDISEEKEIDQAKTEVVSFTSHQLRTPLSVINWYSEKLLSGDFGPLNHKQREYLHAIYTTAQKTTGLVNTFLNVSRLQLGTFPTDPKVVDVHNVIKDVLSELKLKINHKQINVIRKSRPNVALAWVDLKLIRIVLQNLFSNAVKYTPSGGKITYELGTIEEDMGNNQNRHLIMIRIKDSGYGIPKKEQSKIFTKLFRGGNVKERDIEGLGIGLYMVKTIVEHLNGSIWFNSKINKGTTFYITLPTALENAPEKLPIHSQKST